MTWNSNCIHFSPEEGFQYDDSSTFFFIFSLESIKFAKLFLNQILYQKKRVSLRNSLFLDDEKIDDLHIMSWNTINVKGTFSNIEEEFALKDYLFLVIINIDDCAFQNVPSLVISDLPVLQILRIDSKCFYHTKSVQLASIILCL